jgi:dihydroflavonol-4-reductase
MTTVVTGAAGHIGGNLVRELVAQGRSVRALVYRDRRAIEGLDVEVVIADLLDRESLSRAFAGADTVYHLAGRIVIYGCDEEQVHAVNVLGTRNVVETCLDLGVKRLVHFSSIHAVAQEPLDRPLDEGRPLADTGPCLLYDRTKALGQKEVMAGVDRGLDAVIVSPGGVMGPHDYKPSHIGEMLLSLHDRRIPALVPGGFTWVDVRDAVQGAIAAEERGRTGEAYLLGGEWVSILDLSRWVAELTGARTPQTVLPMWLARVGAPFVTGYARLRGRRPLFTAESLSVIAGNTRMNCDKAKRELNFLPRPVRETVEDTLLWFSEAGMLKNGS